MDTNHYMYVLECSDGTWYTGYTTDVERRLEEHNSSSLGAKYTKARRPVTLVAFASFDTRKQALKAEYHFKGLPKKKKIRIVDEAMGDSQAFALLLSDMFSIE